MTGGPLFREHGRQVAALCWRPHGPVAEILLITSLNSGRWIIPKGWPEPELTMAESAAREAFEEAGVTGDIQSAALGAYHYLKEKRDGVVPCSVDVFVLKVTRQLNDWPEKGARQMAWLPAEQAAARVAEPGLRQILHAFHKHQASPKARYRAG
ncbi:MAG TPA: NUDIX hydrolase [Rhizomicrobium sp.]|nr:NUDIX hydrolase [Rhizomicrobium sp.]